MFWASCRVLHPTMRVDTLYLVMIAGVVAFRPRGFDLEFRGRNARVEFRRRNAGVEMVKVPSKTYVKALGFRRSAAAFARSAEFMQMLIKHIVS